MALDERGVTFKVVSPYGEVTLWKQESGLWWCDLSGSHLYTTPHTPEPLGEAVATALRYVGINKDDI